MARKMDYFGAVLDELTELYEEIEASPHAGDAVRLLRSLERAMKVAVEIEIERTRTAGAPPQAMPISKVA